MTKLYISQYGDRFYAKTLKELRQQIPGCCSKMYVDRNGKTLDIGYVIDQLWLTAYIPFEKEA